MEVRHLQAHSLFRKKKGFYSALPNAAEFSRVTERCMHRKVVVIVLPTTFGRSRHCTDMSGARYGGVSLTRKKADDSHRGSLQARQGTLGGGPCQCCRRCGVEGL